MGITTGNWNNEQQAASLLPNVQICAPTWASRLADARVQIGGSGAR
jgi:hypothetical protein